MGLVIRWAGSRNAYNILVRKSREDMGRPLHRWEDHIKIDYTGGWEVVDWVCVTHSRVRLLAILKMVINIQVS
jgi:hypothetical protein